MIAQLLQFLQPYALLPIRFAVGLVFLYHGSGKLFLGNGPQDFAVTLSGLGILQPVFCAWFIAIMEFLGGIAILIGLFIRYFALVLMGIMAGAIFTVHLYNGFSFMTNGFEYQFVLLLACFTLFIAGSGPFALRHRR